MAAARIKEAIRDRLVRAERLAAVGEVGRAAREVDKVVRREPARFEAWHLKGVLALARGEAQPAVVALRRATELAPDDATCWTNLGIAEHRAGCETEAEHSLRRATELAPNLAPAHYNLGLVLRERGAVDSALVSLRQAVTSDPAYAKAWLELGRGRRQQGASDDALAALARAGALADALEESGQIEQECGRYAAAVGHYEACLQADPDRPATRVALAGCLQESGRLDDAVGHYQRALAADPGLYPAALKSLTTASTGCLWSRPDDLRRVLLGG